VLNELNPIVVAAVTENELVPVALDTPLIYIVYRLAVVLVIAI
jgi:hypothetical protein